MVVGSVWGGGQWGHYGRKLWRNYSAGDSFNSTANSGFRQTDSLFLVLSASNLLQFKKKDMQTFSLFFKIMHFFKDFVEIITKLWSEMHPFLESKTRINTEHSNEREWTYNNFALQQ